MERSPLQEKFEDFDRNIKWIINNDDARSIQYQLYKTLIQDFVDHHTTGTDIDVLMSDTINKITTLQKTIFGNINEDENDEDENVEKKIQHIWNTIQTQLNTIFNLRADTSGDTDITGSVNHHNFATECDIYHDTYTELKSLLQSNEKLTPNEQTLLSNLDFVNTLLRSITPNMITSELHRILTMLNDMLMLVKSKYDHKINNRVKMVTFTLNTLESYIPYIYTLLYGTGTFTQKYKFHNGYITQKQHANEGEHISDV